MRDYAVGRTTEPFRERLHLHQRRASLQSHRRDPVRHRRHRNRHGARRPHANSEGSLCYAPSLSAEGENGEGGRGCVVTFETFWASRRVDLSVCVPCCYR